MSKLTYLFIALAFLSACSGSPVKTDTQQSTARYETYHNQFYDYSVKYPNFLIPLGEATNQDGQKFLSEDERIQLLVYRDYKNDYLAGGNLYTIGEAFEEDLKSKEGVFKNKLGDNHYIIQYKADDVLHLDYALLYGDNYFNIRFEYPENEKDRMKGIIEHVINSLKVNDWDAGGDEPGGNASARELGDGFPAFLKGFLNECYWNKNFNSLLRNNDKTLANYLDSKMDVRRYYASGTVAILATRAEDFGFAPEDDFMSKPSATGDLIFEYVNDFDNSTPCDLIYSNINVIYYVRIKSVPDVVVNTETFETRPVKIAYPEAEIMAVYLPNSYDNPRGFYFIHTPDGWKLAFVDDSLCEA
jgi:hypothetical protein